MASIKILWSNYLEKSSLHGFRYIVDKESKLWERLMWILLLAIAGVSILVQLYISWEIYSKSSIQIVVDNPRFPLSKIDFPAITFCSVNKILYSKAKELILNKYDTTELREKYENSLYVLGMLQYPHYKDLSSFIKKNPIVNLPIENITYFMLKLMPTIDEMFDSCYWRGSKHKCTDIIRLQRTEEGYCYSFNSKTSERSTNDNRFNPPMDGPDGLLIPLRNNAAGKMTGLEVITKSLITEYFPKDRRSKGYNIMIHTPEDFPDISSSYKLYSEFNQSSRISVSVKHIQADRSLRLLSEKDRKCFLFERRSSKDENMPSYWSNAEDNCYSRCRLRTTQNICKCTPYYFDMKANKKHCGIEHIQCLGTMDVLQHNIQSPQNEPGFPEWSIPSFMNCSCPHPCSFVGYTTEIRNFAKDFIDNTIDPPSYIHIDIHFKERFAISYQRSMKYSTQNILVTFGGMASLFLGCSLVSVVEIIYIVFKSLMILKSNYTKVITPLKQHHVIQHRRKHQLNSIQKPLYIQPSNKSQTTNRHDDNYYD